MARSRGRKRNGEPSRMSAGHGAKVIVADSEKNADMLYATGVRVPDPFVFFQYRGKRHVMVSAMEYSRVKREARVDDVFSFSQIRRRLGKSQTGRPADLSDLCGAMFREKGIRGIVVPRWFPLGLAEDLRERGFEVRCGPDPFFPARALKGEGEVESMKKVLLATQHGMKVAVGVLREARVEKRRGRDLLLGAEPVTARRLRFLIHSAVQEKECTAMHTIVACGAQGYDPHERGTGPLRAGEPIVVDIFPRSDVTGYHGDMTRTFVKGKASERVRQMYGAVREAQDFAIANIRPGIQSKKIHQGVREVFRRRGFPQEERDGKSVGFIHGTGHGVGLEIHEYPWIGERSCRLASGHVVTVEPGLYYPDVGGVRLEDVVWIRPDGAMKLTRMERRLEIP